MPWQPTSKFKLYTVREEIVRSKCDASKFALGHLTQAKALAAPLPKAGEISAETTRGHLYRKLGQLIGFVLDLPRETKDREISRDSGGQITAEEHFYDVTALDQTGRCYQFSGTSIRREWQGGELYSYRTLSGKGERIGCERRAAINAAKSYTNADLVKIALKLPLSLKGMETDLASFNRSSSVGKPIAFHLFNVESNSVQRLRKINLKMNYDINHPLEVYKATILRGDVLAVSANGDCMLARGVDFIRWIDEAGKIVRDFPNDDRFSSQQPSKCVGVGLLKRNKDLSNSQQNVDPILGLKELANGRRIETGNKTSKTTSPSVGTAGVPYTLLEGGNLFALIARDHPNVSWRFESRPVRWQSDRPDKQSGGIKRCGKGRVGGVGGVGGDGRCHQVNFSVNEKINTQGLLTAREIKYSGRVNKTKCP